jgi:SAM-dependent methyltransferase
MGSELPYTYWDPALHNILKAEVDSIVGIVSDPVILKTDCYNEVIGSALITGAKFIDRDPDMVERAKKLGIDCVTCRLGKTGFEDSYFDIVLYILTFNWANSPIEDGRFYKKAIVEFSRLLKKGGYLLFIDWATNKSFLKSELDKYFDIEKENEIGEDIVKLVVTSIKGRTKINENIPAGVKERVLNTGDILELNTGKWYRFVAKKR